MKPCPLAVRDASALSLATALDFEQEPRTAPTFDVAPLITGLPCPASGPVPLAAAGSSVPNLAREDKSARLYDLARAHGWRV